LVCIYLKIESNFLEDTSHEKKIVFMEAKRKVNCLKAERRVKLMVRKNRSSIFYVVFRNTQNFLYPDCKKGNSKKK
ncbi:hypothetical protein L9F63_022211, partial [Diploptera punctata]